ncbi:MAG: hypothetical protein WBA12_00415 [Catalinimonas sp.]
MRIPALPAVLLAAVAACQPTREPVEKKTTLTYPTTRRVDTVDTYFGVEVADPTAGLKTTSRPRPPTG